MKRIAASVFAIAFTAYIGLEAATGSRDIDLQKDAQVSLHDQTYNMHIALQVNHGLHGLQLSKQVSLRRLASTSNDALTFSLSARTERALL